MRGSHAVREPCVPAPARPVSAKLTRHQTKPPRQRQKTTDSRGSASSSSLRVSSRVSSRVSPRASSRVSPRGDLFRLRVFEYRHDDVARGDVALLRLDVSVPSRRHATHAGGASSRSDETQGRREETVLCDSNDLHNSLVGGTKSRNRRVITKETNMKTLK